MENNQAVRFAASARKDYWPAARLLIVAVLFCLWSHWRFQWSAPSLSELGKSLMGMLAIFCLLALISQILARLYVAAVVFPVYATTVLNDWLYGACYWTFRTLLRLLYMRRVSALVALLSELGLFLALWQLIAGLLRKYGQ